MFEQIITYLSKTFVFTKWKIILSFLISCIGALMWWYTVMIKALFILMIIDFFLWFTLAWRDDNIREDKIKDWLKKFATYCITLMVFNHTDIALMGFNVLWMWVLELWIWYLSLNESLSTLKHLEKFWVPIPKKLIKKLENFRDDFDNKNINNIKC